MSGLDFHGHRVRENNNIIRPAGYVPTGTIGMIFTGPDADPDVWPLNTPVVMLGRNEEMIAALNTTGGPWRGTGPWAFDGIHDQGEPGPVVAVRVDRHPKPITSVLVSITDKMTYIEGELVNRATGTESDELANADVNAINKVWSGNTDYLKNHDYKLVGDSIEWQRYDTVETVARRTSTVDPLKYAETNLGILEVSQGETQFVDGTDYEIHAEGIEWLVGGNSPDVHSEYLCTYDYGRRPSSEQDYEVNYTHYSYERITDEVVNRNPNSNYDALEQNDILRAGPITAGAEIYIENTDWKLDNSRIFWEPKDDIAPITKSGYVLGTPVYGTNAGAGTIGSITQDVDTQVGSYQLVVTDDSISGGEVWSVTTPDSTVLATATTGVAYDSDHLDFTITAGGATDFENGDTITIPITGGIDKLTYVDTIDYAVANTGDGTVGSITFGSAVQNGDYVITCDDASTPTAETFEIIGPDSVSIGTATTGVAFVHADLSLTITAGAANWIVGDEITVPIVVHSPDLLSVSEISQGVDLFTVNVDFEVTIDGEIDWISDNLPAVGSVFNVTLKFNHQPADDTDYTVESYDFKSGEIVALGNVIGGVSEEGWLEGVHALLGEHEGLKPKILIAPGFTHHASVVQEMLGIAEQNRAIIVADGPQGNNAAWINYRQNFGSPRVYLVGSHVFFDNNKYYVDNLLANDGQPASARVAGRIARNDQDFGYWRSPSNTPIIGINGATRRIPNTGVGGVANHLNRNDVTVIINGKSGGFKIWGNRSCDNGDYISPFLCVRRTDDHIAELATGIYDSAIIQDAPIDEGWFERVTISLSSMLRDEEARGAIILGKSEYPAWVDPANNSPTAITAGRTWVKYDYMFKPPAEDNISERYINQNYLTEIFSSKVLRS